MRQGGRGGWFQYEDIGFFDPRASTSDAGGCCHARDRCGQPAPDSGPPRALAAGGKPRGQTLLHRQTGSRGAHRPGAPRPPPPRPPRGPPRRRACTARSRPPSGAPCSPSRTSPSGTAAGRRRCPGVGHRHRRNVVTAVGLGDVVAGGEDTFEAVVTGIALTPPPLVGAGISIMSVPF